MEREPRFALTILEGYVDQQVCRYSVEKLQQIVKVLLRFGADPNCGHSYPVPAYTPLMLAAESDLAGIFYLTDGPTRWRSTEAGCPGPELLADREGVSLSEDPIAAAAQDVM